MLKNQKFLYLIKFSVLCCLCLGVPFSLHAADFSLKLSDTQKQTILNYARATLIGESPKELPAELVSIKNPLILMLFHRDGQLMGQIRIDGDDQDLKMKIKQATFKLQKQMRDFHIKNRRNAFIDSLKRASDPYQSQESFLHVLLVDKIARFANFGIKGIFDNKVFEPQVTGLIYELNQKRVEANPIEAVMTNADAQRVRAYLARELKIEPKNIIRQNDLKVEIYTVQHFAESFPDRHFSNYHRGHEVFTAEQVTSTEIKKRLELIGEWYKHNVKNGEVTYKYDIVKATFENDQRTMVRSTMAVWVLNKLAQQLNHEKLKELAQKTINFYLERYFNIKKSLAAGRIIPSEQPIKKGELVRNRYTTAGFLALALIEALAFETHQKEIELLMDWLMSFQRADGIFKTQFAQSQYFMPGQALLAVASLYEKTKAEKYKTFFEKSFLAYALQIKDMMALGPKTYTPYAPAWFTQPLAKMYLVTQDERYRDLIFEINDRVVLAYELNAAHQRYFDYDGILAPKAGSMGNVSITAAALESLVDALRVAKASGDEERVKKYQYVIKRSVAYLFRLQYTPANTYYVHHRSNVVGGFKTDLVNTKIWMDNVWHFTSALLKIEAENIL